MGAEFLALFLRRGGEAHTRAVAGLAGGFGGAGVDVGVRVPRGEGGGNDGVPDDGFGVGDGRRGGGRGEDGDDVDEELFGVPGEEGGEVGVEIEFDVGVFFLFGGVVVWPSFYAERRSVSSRLQNMRERGPYTLMLVIDSSAVGA